MAIVSGIVAIHNPKVFDLSRDRPCHPAMAGDNTTASWCDGSGAAYNATVEQLCTCENEDFGSFHPTGICSVHLQRNGVGFITVARSTAQQRSHCFLADASPCCRHTQLLCERQDSDSWARSWWPPHYSGALHGVQLRFSGKEER